MAGALCSLLMAGLWGTGFADSSSKVEMRGLRLCFESDKTVYMSGEPVKLRLQVTNEAREEIRLQFKESQRFDFILGDSEGKEVWRWSEGQMFAQVLGEEILGPRRKSLIYTAEFRGKLQPGTYKVSGVIVSRGLSLSSSMVISVK